MAGAGDHVFDSFGSSRASIGCRDECHLKAVAVSVDGPGRSHNRIGNAGASEVVDPSGRNQKNRAPDGVSVVRHDDGCAIWGECQAMFRQMSNPVERSFRCDRFKASRVENRPVQETQAFFHVRRVYPDWGRPAPL